MTSSAHHWKPGDAVYCRYFDHATAGYIGRLAGYVTGVGKAGVTIRRVKPDHEGKREQRIGFHDVWPSQEAIDEAIRLHPSPNFGKDR